MNYKKILKEIKNADITWDYIKSEKFKSYIGVFTSLRGKNIKYLAKFLYHTIDPDQPEVFRVMFDDQFWEYLDFYCFYKPGHVYKNPKKHTFKCQADELAYMTKKALIRSSGFKISTKLSIPKILLEISKTKKYNFETMSKLYYDNGLSGLSVSVIGFIYEYLLESRNVVTCNMDAIDRLGHNKIDFALVIKMLKTMTYEEIIASDRNAFNYYFILNQNKIIAIKSFLLHLNIICDLDDSEEITISKESVRALFSVPEICSLVCD